MTSSPTLPLFVKWIQETPAPLQRLLATPKNNWNTNTTKNKSLPRNKRSGISAHPKTRIGRRSKIHQSHEKQEHWPINRHPLHDHPVFDCYIRENLSNKTDWPTTEHQVNTVSPTDPDWCSLQPSQGCSRIQGNGYIPVYPDPGNQLLLHNY